MRNQVEVAIIGGGTAGLSALREVRRSTDDFLIIDAGDWGTTCAARGCMPSKALIEAANAFHDRRRLEAFGVSGADALRIDIPAVLRRVRALRDGFVRGPQKVAQSLADKAISGKARLLGPGRIDVNGVEVKARRIIIATGSRPLVPAEWRSFGERLLTSDTIFEQTNLPRRMAVIGLGAVGLELAQALARLGVEVAGFNKGEMLGGVTDPEVAGLVRDAMGEEMALHLGTAADIREAGSDGGLIVTGGGGAFHADAVLAALGRQPNIDCIGLETLGAPLDERGLPPVDPNTMQIGDLPVWLAGDAEGEKALLHEAADEGHIAGRNAIARTQIGYCRRAGLSIVFTSPGIARVGSRHADLAADEIVIGAVDFSRQGRARVAQRDKGLLRVYCDKASGKLVGAEMCAPAGEHLAHLLALAIQQGLHVREMLAMPFYHPVLEEGLRTALRAAARQVSADDSSDLAHCPGLDIPALE